MRRLSVLLHYLPPGSASWAAQNEVTFGWDLNSLLIADVFHATSGEPHPSRPNGKANADPKKAKQLADRLMAQRARLQKNN